MLNSLYTYFLWWVDPGQLTDDHQVNLSLPLLNRMEGEKKKKKCAKIKTDTIVSKPDLTFDLGKKK